MKHIGALVIVGLLIVGAVWVGFVKPSPAPQTSATKVSPAPENPNPAKEEPKAEAPGAGTKPADTAVAQLKAAQQKNAELEQKLAEASAPTQPSDNIKALQVAIADISAKADKIIANADAAEKQRLLDKIHDLERALYEQGTDFRYQLLKQQLDQIMERLDHPTSQAPSASVAATNDAGVKAFLGTLFAIGVSAAACHVTDCLKQAQPAAAAGTNKPVIVPAPTYTPSLATPSPPLSSFTGSGTCSFKMNDAHSEPLADFSLAGTGVTASGEAGLVLPSPNITGVCIRWFEAVDPTGKEIPNVDLNCSKYGAVVSCPLPPELTGQPYQFGGHQRRLMNIAVMHNNGVALWGGLPFAGYTCNPGSDTPLPGGRFALTCSAARGTALKLL